MLTKFIWILRKTLFALLVIYGIVPIVVKLYPKIMHYVVFLHFLRFPIGYNLSDVSQFHLPATRNFYLPTTSESTCGVWHILPKSLQNNEDVAVSDGEKIFMDLLRGSEPIVLYLHGNSATRGAAHRVELYKLLSSLDYHVIAFDYRGYGDSTGSPSEAGMVEDAINVYEWIREHKKPSTSIIVWGQSLGTAVATSLTAYLSKVGSPPHALILEAPFTNMVEAASNHPFSMLYRLTPYFDWVFLAPLAEELNIRFNTDVNILDVNCRVMILHALDDDVVPFTLGHKLYNTAESHIKSKGHRAQFVQFDGSHSYGHKYIHLAPELPNIIKQFVND